MAGMTYNTSGQVWSRPRLYPPYNVTLENYCFGDNIASPSITIDNTVHRNCSEICTTPGLLFSGVTAFEKCFYIAGNATDQSLTALSKSASFNATINRSAAITNDCLLESCLSRGKKRDECLHLNSSVTQFQGMYSSSFRNRVLPVICPTVDGEVSLNSDIGGPGVWISYIIQISLVIIFGIAILLRRMQKVYTNTWDLNFVQRFCIWIVSWFQISDQNALDELVADFQEAQCFLLLTVQIVTLIAANGTRNMLVVTSGVESAVNYKYAELVGGMGFCLSTFTWFLMRSLGSKISLYFNVLTVLTSLMSLASLGVSRRGFANFAGWRSDLTPAGGARFTSDLQACAELQPPTFYCGAFTGTYEITASTDEFLNMVGSFNIALMSASIAIVAALLFGAGLWLYVNLRGSARTLPDGERQKFNLFCVTLALFAMLMSCVCILVFLGLFRARGYISTEWSVGQAIAVTLWAPVLIRLVHLTIHSLFSMPGEPKLKLVMLENPFNRANVAPVSSGYAGGGAQMAKQ